MLNSVNCILPTNKAIITYLYCALDLLSNLLVVFIHVQGQLSTYHLECGNL